MISELLWCGRENAICTKDLLTITGLKNARTLQNIIERERAEGALILSTSQHGGGYFLPSEGETGIREMLEFERTLNARALNTLRTLKTVRAALKKKRCGDQMEIP